MKAHWSYLKYVVRHKWFVFIACRHLGVSLWRSIIHDWSKFLPCEWFAYVNHFYGNYPAWSSLSSGQKFAGYPYSLSKEFWEDEFNRAWNHHQKSNKHHWQYWLLTNDSDEPKLKPIPMPEKYVREMVADWWGAGRAITGKWDACGWYEKNTGKIIISDDTRFRVESFLRQSRDCFGFNLVHQETAAA